MSSSTSNATSNKNDDETAFNFSEYIPRFNVVRISTGQYSPRTDERCFTYCSQSAKGRSQNQEPWCRTICIRKVNKHEVNRKPKMPLPTEGQPEEAVTNGQVGGIGAQNVKNWQEGRYLWWTKSRWASQERLDIMMLSLEQQLDLLRRKEWSEKQRIQAEQDSLRPATQTPPQVAPHPISSDDKNDANSNAAPNTLFRPVLPNFTDFAANSKLIPLSPLPSEIYSFLKQSGENLIRPTGLALEVSRDAFKSGDQLDIAKVVWEKTKSGEAFELVNKLIVQTWERWKGDDNDKNGD